MVLAEGNQATSSMCFTYYNPQLDHATAEHQVAYDVCFSTFETSSQQVEIDFKKECTCSGLTCCNSSPNAYDAFRCASIKVRLLHNKQLTIGFRLMNFSIL
ncbi:GH18694 [Drosophila grimshawi]|uniref:GH18694 n=1 Tax=Drosophila grimshawi TaxID=7222 RepID=B4JGT5_DROGR|nr:GH18694 [Drosophila grimshawi]